MARVTNRRTSARDQMEDFDPNDPRRQGNYLWATFQPHRRPTFKLHLNRGPALTSCGQEAFYVLYRWDKSQSKWIEVTRVTDRHKHTICHKCGIDVGTGYGRGRLRWYWVGQPTLREVGLCQNCNDHKGPLYKMMRQPIDKRVLRSVPGTTNAP